MTRTPKKEQGVVKLLSFLKFPLKERGLCVTRAQGCGSLSFLVKLLSQLKARSVPDVDAWCAFPGFVASRVDQVRRRHQSDAYVPASQRLVSLEKLNTEFAEKHETTQSGRRSFKRMKLYSNQNYDEIHSANFTGVLIRRICRMNTRAHHDVKEFSGSNCPREQKCKA